MDPIIVNENFRIYKSDENIYKIQFKYTSVALTNSLIKTRLISGAATDPTHRLIKFKAHSVKSLAQYQADYKKTHGRPQMMISDIAKMIRTLTIQLFHIIDTEKHTILGYNPHDIIVIDDAKFAFLGSESVVKIDVNTNMTMISCPFLPQDFFVSPELLTIKQLPAYTHYKTSYFSLGCVIVYALLGNDDFYKDYLETGFPETILSHLDKHIIKDTKIYWLISRCLSEDPLSRSIIMI